MPNRVRIASSNRSLNEVISFYGLSMLVSSLQDPHMLRAIQITGPKHNLLGLELSMHPLNDPFIIETIDKNEVSKNNLSEIEVVKNVMMGVELAETEVGRKFYIKCSSSDLILQLPILTRYLSV